FRISPLAAAPPFDGTSLHLQHWGRRVDSGGFHRHVGTACQDKPIPQEQKVLGRRAKRPDLFAALPLALRQNQTSDYRLLVHIQSTAPFIDKSHATSPAVLPVLLFATWPTGNFLFKSRVRGQVFVSKYTTPSPPNRDVRLSPHPALQEALHSFFFSMGLW